MQGNLLVLHSKRQKGDFGRPFFCFKGMIGRQSKSIFMNNVFSLHKHANYRGISSLVRSTISTLKGKKVLVLGFSNRWTHKEGERDIPKTERLGRLLASSIGSGSEYMDVFKMKIYPCEANISESEGNGCGVIKASLKDAAKNPTGNHRCWASINNKDDELWKVSKALFESEAVLFVTPIRWGQACATYQKLIERLSWLENMHTTLGEKNILAEKTAGFICIGHNWNGENVVKTQKQVLEFFGFNVDDSLCWNWQWTGDAEDETQKGYKKDAHEFASEFVQMTIRKTEND